MAAFQLQSCWTLWLTDWHCDWHNWFTCCGCCCCCCLAAIFMLQLFLLLPAAVIEGEHWLSEWASFAGSKCAHWLGTKAQSLKMKLKTEKRKNSKKVKTVSTKEKVASAKETSASHYICHDLRECNKQETASQRQKKVSKMEPFQRKRQGARMRATNSVFLNMQPSLFPLELDINLGLLLLANKRAATAYTSSWATWQPLKAKEKERKAHFAWQEMEVRRQRKRSIEL